jgi:hypothetical protein
MSSPVATNRTGSSVEYRYTPDITDSGRNSPAPNDSRPRKFACSYQGCTKSFNRKDYLERHAANRKWTGGSVFVHRMAGSLVGIDREAAICRQSPECLGPMIGRAVILIGAVQNVFCDLTNVDLEVKPFYCETCNRYFARGDLYEK